MTTNDKTPNKSTDQDRSPNTDNIPQALRERRQWMLWSASNDVPRRPGGWDSGRSEIDWAASWTSEGDWLTFDEATEAASTDPNYGVGFVFDHRDPYLAIDLDGALRPDSGPKEWLPSIDPFIGETYIELSPSGTGVHIVIEDPDGDGLPEWWSDVFFEDREHEGVEAYERKFFTVTGELLFAERADDHPGEIPENAATTEIGSVDRGDLNEWLATAYEEITGEDPREEDEIGEIDYSYNHQDEEEWFGVKEAEEALSYIDPDISRAHWLPIGYGLVAHFDGATGKQLFDRWSRQGSKYDDDAAETIEGITDSSDSDKSAEVPTIIHHANAGGWDSSGAAAMSRDGLRDALIECGARENDTSGPFTDKEILEAWIHAKHEGTVNDSEKIPRTALIAFARLAGFDVPTDGWLDRETYKTVCRAIEKRFEINTGRLGPLDRLGDSGGVL